jgi:putative transposase
MTLIDGVSWSHPVSYQENNLKQQEYMNFETGNLYHIYNQGNNRQKIFFSRDNYIFFLNKIKRHLLPHADILAWCLMPNHFHLMIYVKDVIIANEALPHGVTRSHPVSRVKEIDLTPSHPVSRVKEINLNNNIAIMLRSYTRAINKQFDRSGNLFRESTKAECLTKINGITPAFFGSHINVRIPEKEYPQVCFNYIHANPVEAKLCKRPEDWEFSSYRDFCGIRNGTLINRERAIAFELVSDIGSTT